MTLLGRLTVTTQTTFSFAAVDMVVCISDCEGSTQVTGIVGCHEIH